MPSSWLAAVLTATTLAASPPAPPSSPAPGSAGASGPAARERWIEATPLDRQDPAKVFPLGPEAQSVRLEGVEGLVMLCAGGKDVATVCERRSIGPGESLPLAPLPAGVRLQGRLVAGKAPLTGAKVAVLPERLAARRPFSIPLWRAGTQITRQVESDEKGRFSMPRLAPGRYVLEISSPGGRIDESDAFTVSEPEKLRGKRAALGPPVLDLGDLPLEEGLRLEVTVLTSEGEPVSGATVGLLQERAGRDPLFFGASTGVDGIAKITRLDPSLPVQVSCTAPGYVRGKESFASPPAAARCSLERVAGIEGRVTGEEDAAVPGATVTLRRTDRATQTQDDGSFSFEDLVPGRYDLVAAVPGLRAAERQVSLRQGERRALPPIQLLAAAELTGLLLEDSPGETPVAGARVTVVEPPGGGSAVSDQEGRFQVRTGSDLAIRLEVRADGFPPESVEVSPGHPPEEPLEVRLRRGGYVRVSVWDEENDAPCLGCSVSMMSHDRPSPGILLTDRQGEVVSPPLAPGSWQVYLEALRSSGSYVTVRGGDNIRLVEVESGVTTPVRFGERRISIEVSFSSPPPAGWTLQAVGPAGVAPARRQDDGSFLLRKSPGESLVLGLADGAGRTVRQTTVPPAFEEPLLRLPLHDTEVHGILLAGEEPLGLEPVRLVPTTAPSLAASAWTDGEGGFSVPYLPPGTYRLIAGDRAVATVQVTAGAATDLGPISLQ